MSGQINNGGPAFPIPSLIMQNGNVALGDPGMTLRDYFAVRATEQDIREHRKTDGHGAYVGSREAAKFAHADAMLAARGPQA